MLWLTPKPTSIPPVKAGSDPDGMKRGHVDYYGQFNIHMIPMGM